MCEWILCNLITPRRNPSHVSTPFLVRGDDDGHHEWSDSMHTTCIYFYFYSVQLYCLSFYALCFCLHLQCVKHYKRAEERYRRRRITRRLMELSVTGAPRVRLG